MKGNVFEKAISKLPKTAAEFKKSIKYMLIFPAMGLAAHLFSGTNFTDYQGLDTQTGSDYSLSHRFETAFSFNTPEEHKYYHATSGYWDATNGFDAETSKERYLASPWATYPILAALALMGTKAARTEEEKKRNQVIAMNKRTQGR